LIAGHTFVEQRHGRVCECGCRWVNIAGVSREDVGKADIAHSGSLTEAEYEQIVAERMRAWEAGRGT
jgi:hypothetical protein